MRKKVEKLRSHALKKFKNRKSPKFDMKVKNMPSTMMWVFCNAGVCVILIMHRKKVTKKIRHCQQQRYRYRVILTTSKSVSKNNVSETSNLIVSTHKNRLRPCVRETKWYNFQVNGCFWLNANQTISMALILAV